MFLNACFFFLGLSIGVLYGFCKNKQVFEPEKICKNCNFYVPCVSSMGNLKGACRNCCVDTYHFSPDMSCGHFEYTEAIQNIINKKLLEKCYKK